MASMERSTLVSKRASTQYRINDSPVQNAREINDSKMEKFLPHNLLGSGEGTDGVVTKVLQTPLNVEGADKSGPPSLKGILQAP